MNDAKVSENLRRHAKLRACVLCWSVIGGVAVGGVVHAGGMVGDYSIRAAGVTDVQVTGGFWLPRIETNRLVTLKADFAKCNETPRIANFTNAANRAIGSFGGIPFDDSDVFKVMEGAAYVYAQTKDAELKKYMDALIGEVAKAQEPDGYLYTARTLGYNVQHWNDKDLPWQVSMMGPTRWSNLGESHELYNQGHMIEAAVAWFEATGERNFLEVAIKSADMMCRTFGPEKSQLKLTSGHQEIELALCKLYRVTKERKYLDLAKFFLDMRGRKDVRPLWGAAMQDHLPVCEQPEAVGHAVRAGYMYSGMADVAALTGDRSYVTAINRLWENVVGRKMSLNGGIGTRSEMEHREFGHLGETFSYDYDITNDFPWTYNETCATIANVLWNQRMFLMHGDAKYVDVMELAIYNGFLSGISLSGDEFFYPNPLACKGGYKRSKWFGCSCCPVNDVRFIPQIPTFAYATDGKGTLYWNLFIEGEATVAGTKFRVETDYPWKGQAKLTLLSSPSPSSFASLKIRLPGWAVGRIVPSDLYVQTQPASFFDVQVAVNGAAVNGCPGNDGYIAVSRAWKAGDVVTLDLPMPVKRIRAHEKVEADRGRLAVMRGPVLFCAEGVDNAGKAYGLALSADAAFAETTFAIGGETFPMLTTTGAKLVPYCTWGNRKPGNDLQCWFKTDK